MISAPYVGKKTDADKNEDAFTLVTAHIQTTIRENSLYRLIADIHSEDRLGVEVKERSEASILSGYHIDSLNNQQENAAWLIRLDQTPENHLFLEEGFEFQENHLRVDKHFANDNTLKAEQGFTACHYTAKYVHAVSKNFIIVHGYIGQNALFKSCQIKQYEPGGNGKQKQLKVSTELKKIVKKNARSALELSEKLILEKNNRYQEVVEQSYKVEPGLNTLLQKILANETQDNNRLQLAIQYQALIERFLKIVAKINRYNDQEIDKRGEPLKSLGQYMNNRTTLVDSTESEAQNQNEPEDLVEITQTNAARETHSMEAPSKIEMKLKQDKDILVDEINELLKTIKELNNETTKLEDTQKLRVTKKNLKVLSKTKNMPEILNLIACRALKLTLRSKLVELAFIPGITQKDNVLLEQAAHVLNNVPDFLKIFKDAVESGDVEQVRQLYSHMQHENLWSVFFTLIVNKLMDAKGEELKKLIEVVEYLYENSYRYRVIIGMLASVSLDLGHARYSSLLVKAYMNDNYLVFNLLLKQGFKANGIGFSCEEATITVINALVFYRSMAGMPQDLKYIEILLEFGAVVDFKTTEQKVKTNTPIDVLLDLCALVDCKKSALNRNIDAHVRALVKQKIIKQAAHEKANKRSLEDLREKKETCEIKMMKRFLSNNSALEMHCRTSTSPSTELVTILARRSNLSALLGAAVFLTNGDDAESNLVLGTAEGRIILCPNEKVSDAVESVLVTNQHCTTLMVFPAEPKQKNDAWLQSTSIILNALVEKYKETAGQYPEQISLLRDALMEKARRGADLSERIHFYMSSLYLQILNQTPSYEDTYNMAHTLSCIGTEYYHDMSSNQFFRAYATYDFHQALLCCTNNSLYSQALQSTPLFQYIESMLLRLGRISSASQLEKMESLQAQLAYLALPTRSAETPSEAEVPVEISSNATVVLQARCIAPATPNAECKVTAKKTSATARPRKH